MVLAEASFSIGIFLTARKGDCVTMGDAATHPYGGRIIQMGYWLLGLLR